MNWIDGHDLKSMAFCNVCQKAFDISNMGEAALKSHAKGAKHMHALKEKLELTKNSKISDFVVQASTSTTARPVACTSGSIVSKESDSERKGTVGLSAFVTNDNVLKAEILWTLKVVTSHFSFNSSLKVPWLFQSMFPDSLIAAKMTMSERKCAYFATFGLGPHFLDLLKNKAKSAGEFVLLFDESLNEDLQKKQMDVHVRFWDCGSVSVLL